MFGIDPIYFLFILPGMALSMWASFRVKSAFNKYSQVRVSTGLTGAQAARLMLDRAGLHDVQIGRAHGFLSDHYNPANRSLALSEAVYDSNSIAAVGVATHEAGHAIQHAKNYSPLWLRSVLVPTANIGSSLGYFVMMIGLFLAQSSGNFFLFNIGLALFSCVLLFQVVTLPVEFDATARAKRLVLADGIVSPQERVGMDRVLNAAALTYVAAAVSTLLTLLYFLMRAGLLGGRSRD
ncbi:MAG: zinc metallopeptidase [Acidobacteria bacterium]|nr:zinc metallopeptidase [Acidobacteriota bacterium]